MSSKLSYEELEKRVQELAQVELERKKTEEELDQIFSMSLDMICIADINTATFIKINSAFTKILGYTEKELLEKPFLDFIHLDDIDATRTVIEKELQMGAKVINFENRYRCKDGSYRWLSWVSHPNKVKGVTYAVARDITDLKHKEVALIKSKALLDATGRMARVGGWELDVDTMEITWTEETYSIHEVPLDRKPSLKEAINFFHPEDRSQLELAIKRAIDHGEMYDLEIRFITAQGNHLWTHTICQPEIINGKVVRLLGTFQDITDRKRAEEALRESEKELQRTLGATTDGIWTWNFKTNKMSFSPKYYKMLGFEPNEFPPDFNNWTNLIHPDDREKAIAVATEYLKTKSDFYENEFRLRTKNGDYRCILSRARVVERDKKNDAVYMIGNHEDITDRKRAEEALINERDLFERIMGTSPAGIVRVNADGVIAYANKLAEKLLGIELQGTKRRTYNDPVWKITDFEGAPFPEEKLPFAMVKQTNKPVFNVQHAIEWPDGRRILLSINAAPLINSEGQFDGMVAAIEDITERKRLEEELLRAQKIESVGLLAGGIAHDFNNILTTIIGNVSMAKNQVTPNEELFDLLNEAEIASTRAQTLTKQLLTFAKGGVPVKETASIKDILKESSSFMLRGSKSSCEFSITEDLWPAEIDVGQISQAINNIVINANQAMPKGGVIQVAAVNLIIEGKHGLPLKPGRYIRISIIDQGVGIAKEHLLNIFDPYFTTKQEGSGLGLATTYCVIKKHDGHIAVESQLGVGSTFHVYLPASDKTVPEKEEVRLITGQGRILVMDDEASLRKMVGRMLEHLGYESEFAKDGAEAIRMVQEAQESGKPYDAVILDLTIPGGMGGKKAIQKLLKIEPEVKAIVSSGYSDDPVLANFREYGFKGMMPKPFESLSLGKVLHEVLHGIDDC